MMTYNENILNEARRIIAEKKLDATIEMNGLSAIVTIDKMRKDFVTPKLAKIYLTNYKKHDTIYVEAPILASGIVSQKNDEPLIKRRGRPKKADNDRRKLL
jgi:hypothetical protein